MHTKNIWHTLKNYALLPGIFCCALIPRLLFFIFFLCDNPCMLMYDSGHYHNLARNLTQYGAFVNNDMSPHFYRLPLYPGFLSCWYYLFGNAPYSALLAQIFISASIPLLVYALCRKIFPRNRLATLLSTFVSCFHLGFITFSGLIMAETLYVIFFLSFFYLWYTNHLSSKLCIMPCLTAGMLLGLCTLTRSVGIELLIICLILTWFEHGSVKKKVFGWSLLCISSLLTVSTWIIRNYMLTGALFLYTFPGPHLLNHVAIPVTMTALHIPYQEAQRTVYDQYDAACKNIDSNRPDQQIAASRCAQNIAITTAKTYPISCCMWLFKNALKTLFGLYSSELLCIDSQGQLPPYDQSRGWHSMFTRFLSPTLSHEWLVVVIYCEVLLWLFMLFGIAGTLWHARYNQQLQTILYTLGAFICVFIILSAACGYARLRLPIEPFLIMLASRFWSIQLSKKGVEV